EPAGLDRKGFRPRRGRIDGVDLRVENDEIRVLRRDGSERLTQRPWRAGETCEGSARPAHKFSAAEVMFRHRRKTPIADREALLPNAHRALTPPRSRPSSPSPP